MANTVNTDTGLQQHTLLGDLNSWISDPDDPGHKIEAGKTGISAWFDCQHELYLSLFLASANNFSYWLQLTDEKNSANPNAYVYCNASGTVYTFTTVGTGAPVVSQGKYIQCSIKAMRFRIVWKNNGTTSEAPYIGVI